VRRGFPTAALRVSVPRRGPHCHTLGSHWGSSWVNIESDAGTLDNVQLDGCNGIPQEYGAQFDLRGAPWWLRIWFRFRFCRVGRRILPMSGRRALFRSTRADSGRHHWRRQSAGG
jgi:hypothetical protein